MKHVIIVGFGPVGRVLADALVANGVPFMIVETNAATVRSQRSLGRSVVHGDAARPEVLVSAGIQDASAVVITMPKAAVALQVCKVARSLAPASLIAIRTRHLKEALQAKQLGADITVVEEIESARAMTTAVTAVRKSNDQRQREDSADPEHRVRPAKSRPRATQHRLSRPQIGTRYLNN